MSLPTNDDLERAAELYLNVPAAGTSFTYADAMEQVGLSNDFSRVRSLQNKVRDIVGSKIQGINLPFDDSTNGKVKRVMNLFKLIPGNPGISEVMRLAGIRQEEITKAAIPGVQNKGPTALYARIIRAKKKLETGGVLPPLNVQQGQAPPPVVDLRLATIYTGEQHPISLMSPLSASDCSSGGHPSFAAGSSSSSSPLTQPLVQIQRRTQTSVPSVSLLTSSKSTRLTSMLTQDVRRTEQEKDDIKKCAYKVGTVLYNQVVTGANPVTKFKGSDKCADAINQMFGMVAVSGSQLISGVKSGRINESPPRPGRPSEIPPEDFKDLTELFYTMCAVEQANADPNRLNRTEEISLLGIIVNTKRRAENKPEMDAVSLYDRIQCANSRKQDIEVVDEREALRVAWSTYKNQRDHYIAWEAACVENGFARMPHNDAEKHAEGHVVFYPGQERRIANLDEMRFTLNGKDEHAGGRPAGSHSSGEVPESGKGSDKSDHVCTITMGIIGNEPMPFLVIFPSQAKDPKNYKINTKNIPSFQMINAQYGYPAPTYFDCTFAVSPKGSMTTPIFEQWVCESVIEAWPDLCDQDGLRSMLKADSGPGRAASGFLSRSHVEGLLSFPGIPNGTEMSQEMDQLFSSFKACAYRNRDKLYRARFECDGASATLTYADIGAILFGGQVKLSNGVVVELENAFALYFSPAHIQAAREKCGYWPATRNALKSDRVRHEVVEGDDGTIATEEDEFGALLDRVERRNHECAASLEAKGYEQASKAKRFVKRITANQVEGRRAVKTEPNTRARQDLLMKCSTAGQFFHITDGGYVMNCADMLLARERKDMLKQAATLQKAKKDLRSYSEASAKASAVFKKPFKKWLLSDLKIAIQYKRGPFKGKDDTRLSAMGKKKLLALYTSKYKGKRRGVRSRGWTPKQEAELNRLLRGDIASVKETAIYAQGLERQSEYLSIKLRTLSSERRKDVLVKLFGELREEEKADLVSVLTGSPAQVTDDEEQSVESDDDDSTLFECESDSESDGSNQSKAYRKVESDEKKELELDMSEEEDELESDENSSEANYSSPSSDEEEDSGAESLEEPAPTRPMPTETSTAESKEEQAESDKSEHKSSLELDDKSSEASYLSPASDEEEDEDAESLEESAAATGPTPTETSNTPESKEEKVESDESEAKSSEEEDELESDDKSKFEDKLQIAEARVKRGVDLEVDDLIVLIQSRGSIPVGSRARQLTQQWKQVESLPKGIWK